MKTKTEVTYSEVEKQAIERAEKPLEKQVVRAVRHLNSIAETNLYCVTQALDIIRHLENNSIVTSNDMAETYRI